MLFLHKGRLLQNGGANFLNHGNDGFKATAIIEYEDEEIKVKDSK